MEVIELIYNWYYTPEQGEVFDKIVVGNEYDGSVVLRIKEHKAQGEGDKWFYDVIFDNGSKMRIFNPNWVFYKEINKNMKNLKKEIWEGWTIQNFIDELEPSADLIITGCSYIKPFQTRDEVKKWCISNQPHYKKYIPEVVDYFCEKYFIK